MCKVLYCIQNKKSRSS